LQSTWGHYARGFTLADNKNHTWASRILFCLVVLGDCSQVKGAG